MNGTILNTKILFYAILCLILGGNQKGMSQIQPEWDRSLGGNIWEELNSIEQTTDGGYIMAGFTSSSQDADVSGVANGGGDYWIVKTDALGQIEWEDNFGGDQLERPWKVLPTTDGGYMVAGYSPSDISGDKSENSRGLDDYWVLKLDNQGTLLWDRTYGGDQQDFCYDMIETTDGGFLLGGRSLSGVSGEKTEANMGNWDYWLVKIDANGTFLWDKTIGGDDEDLLNEMQLAPDGNVIIAGGTRSGISGDVIDPLIGVKDFWLIKVDDANGNLQWQRRYGGTEEDEIFSFVQTSDGGYLLGGGSRSNANPPYKSDNSFGVVDMWLVKTNAAGTVEWDRTFGGTGLDNCYSVRQNSIDYYIISGFSDSDISGNKTTPTNGGFDYWIIYLDNNGNKIWESSLGGAQNDVLENAFQIDDGGYMLAGHSSSDVSGDKMDPSNGFNDFWIIKTVCDVEVDLPDTIVCPNQAVELNAFDGSNCVGCTWVWGDIPTGDSIRVIETDVTTTYSITLTDGVGCSRSDEVTINVIPTNITLDLEDSLGICSGDVTTLNAGNPGNMYNWSSGPITQSIIVVDPGLYTVTVTDNNNCTFTDSTLVSFGNPVIVDLGPDTSLCENGTLTLDAGNPGVSYLWSPGMETQQTIAVSQAGTYSVVVSDGGGCEGTDEINISTYDPPVVISTTTVCNDTNTFYTVVLEITGGDVNSYSITGLSGSFSNNVFTSVPVPKDQPYLFLLNDAQGCNTLPMGGVYDCECTSFAGSLDPNPIIVCGEDTASIIVVEQPILDFNDLSLYVLHTGDINDPASILATANIPEFLFQPGWSYGVTYFVTCLTGNINNLGSIMLEDGCLSLSNSVPVTFYENPTAVIEPFSTLEITCNDPTLILNGTSSQIPGGGDYFWDSFDGGVIVGSTNEPTVEAGSAGFYLLVVSNLAGCTDTATIEITSSDEVPLIDIVPPNPLTCVDTIIQIDASASSTGPGFTAVWAGGMLNGLSTLMPDVSEVGVYILTITDTTNGCTATQSVTVNTLVAEFNVSTDPVSYLDCGTGTASLSSGVFPPGPMYEFNWFTEDGNIVDGIDSLVVTGDSAGVYIIEAINPENGCRDTTAGSILPNPDRPTSAWLSRTFPICLGDNNGSLMVDSVQSGTEPYLYSFNGGPFTDNPFDGFLSAGENNITIQDALGCVWDTTLVYPDGKQVFVDLEEPFGLVELGDSVRIIAVPSEPMDSIYWQIPFPLSCYDCLGPWITPIDSAIIAVEVVNSKGCRATDQFKLLMKKDRHVYIPNAFSPNGNRKNEWFNVYAGKAVKTIRYLRIYNRWGGLIYEGFNLPIGDVKHGWDGNFANGERSLSGVYVYKVEVEYLDGVVEIFTGDLTMFK